MTRNDGTELEELMFRELGELLEGDKLPYRKEIVVLCRRKTYHSRDREDGVTFENVLEVFDPENVGQPEAQPTHVVVFECKDHGRCIGVEVIESVVGKMSSSFGFALKFHVVTRKGFTKRAVNVAKANGVGLIKIMPDDKVHRVMYRMTFEVMDGLRNGFPSRARRALVDVDYESEWEDFYGCLAGETFESLEGLLAYSTA